MKSVKSGSEVLAIIPARGGSKGIPRKNVRSLAGRPLIAWTIEAARQSERVHRVVVSTDDEEIARVSRMWGAEVIDRPAEISGDKATSEAALRHVLDELRRTENYEPDLVVFLQATSPVRRPCDIDRAVDILRKDGADSLFSACPIEGFVWAQKGSRVRAVNYDPARRPRRQDLKEHPIEENGSLYVFKPSILRKHGNRLGGKIAVLVMDRLDSLQVDEPGDLARIERVMAAVSQEMPPSDALAKVRLVVTDFDGVMTDNRVLVDQDGREAVWCSRGDGWGVAQVRKAGIEMVVLSTETNPVVGARCEKLGLTCIQGCRDKLAELKRLAANRWLQPAQVMYLGNDTNDLACLEWVGLSVAVADAEPEACRAARFRTARKGGRGAVREVCAWILAARAMPRGGDAS